MNPTDVQNLLKAFDIRVTLILGLVGLYLANNYCRQVRLSISERRMAAYAQRKAPRYCSSSSAGPLRSQPLGGRIEGLSLGS